jgi:RNA polymerase sigma factor (sigma-70 family)
MTTTEPAALIRPLLDAAAEGDEAAWGELVRRFNRLLWATARGCGLMEADAADVTQTTWLRLAEQLGRISTPEALPGWLVTTTRREAVRVAQRSRRRIPAPLLASVDLDDQPSAVEQLVRSERREELRHAFRRLGERCRMLLALLSADAPCSYAEIADQAGIPIGSIGPTRRRCLTKLANLLERDESAAMERSEASST